jgi:processing peptidase subunit beta
LLQVLLRVDAVDAAAVKAAASAYVNDKEVAVASVGLTHELPDINWFRRRTCE